MGEYSGVDLCIEFASTDISGKARTADISEATGEPEKIDVTTKGDTQRQTLEGLVGADNTTITCTILADDGGSDPVAALSMGASGSLVVYDNGKTHGQNMATTAAARLTDRSISIPYDGAVEWSLTFNSVNAVAYSTYSSA